MSQNKQQKGKAQKKQQQKGKAQNQQQQKTPTTHKIKYVLGSALLIGLVILVVYLYKREKEVETPTQQLEKFQTESPTPSNSSNELIYPTINFDMSKGDTLKICPNGPCYYPPNHVVNINVTGATAASKGIKLDTTNVKRSKDGYLPSFKVTYDQSNTFTCNQTKSINLENEEDNIYKGDDGYRYAIKNIYGAINCPHSRYAVLDFTVPTDIPYVYSKIPVNEGLIIDMTQMKQSTGNCSCNYKYKGPLLYPSVHIQYDALTAETPAAE